MPRITTCQSFQTHPYSPQQTIFSQGLTCIIRTSWDESASRGFEWANEILVAMYHCNQEPAHCVTTRLKSLLKPSIFEVFLTWSDFLIITTKSTPKYFILCKRKRCRIWRFAEFLSTALGNNRFAATMPSLEIPELFEI